MWIEKFERTCEQMGVGSTMFYEYFIGKYIYTDPPYLTEVRRSGRQLALHFTKRLDAKAAADPAHYELAPVADDPVAAVRSSARTSHPVEIKVTEANVDGSLVFLSVSGLRTGQLYELTIRDLPDDPDRRLFKDHQAVVQNRQTVRFRY